MRILPISSTGLTQIYDVILDRDQEQNLAISDSAKNLDQCKPFEQEGTDVDRLLQKLEKVPPLWLSLLVA